MKLSRVERLILANQYLILEALYPEEADGYARHRAVVQNGYELEYDWIAKNIADKDDPLSAEECREVIDIMDMFEAIRRVGDKSGIEEWRTTFSGFDGNNEARQMSYARHFCENGERFRELHKGDDFNSHAPLLPFYRAMLKRWREIGGSDKFQLSKEDVVRITSVKPGEDF